jgi:phosphate starvation-inducible protein PhoH
VSGLPQFIKVAETMNEFCRIHFTPDDIVRSGLVKSWIMAEEKYESIHGKCN